MRVRRRAANLSSGFTYGKADKAAGRSSTSSRASWLFSTTRLIDARVDVLLIRWGRPSSGSRRRWRPRVARNLILLEGTRLQLPQVTRPTTRAAADALGHVLLDGWPCCPADRGVFIEETRRMHPDICRFISDQIYEGRLGWHDDCENQTTATGTGLRWLHANHEGNSTSSVEEAQIIADQIAKLVGTPWTDSSGVVRPLTVTDLMVVAPITTRSAPSGRCS